MCGIAGIIRANTSPSDLSSIASRMAAAMTHRGPDSFGVWSSNNLPIALSHRRLSILDLSPLGHQPMQSRHSGSVIAFNGEIYNFQQIRKELETRGKEFKGHSDTEVLLAAIDVYGFEKAIELAKGMFAITYFDESSGILKLARDRIGEKPLYYGVVNGSFTFASELKSIYAEYPPSDHLTINKQALNSFLRYGYISAPQTIFNEIHKLPPGEVLTLNIGRWLASNDDVQNHVSTSPFWRLQEVSQQICRYTEENANEALEDLDTLLNNIIQEQSVADVPLGSFLSGGIDSSLVSAYLQAQSSTQIDTFTIGFDEKEFNEAEHAKQVSKHIGSSHNEYYLSVKEARETIPKITEINDEPFANASQLPTYLVSKFAKTKLTVCLSGDGGDELFCGYNRYIEGRRFNQLANKIPLPLRRGVRSAVNHAPPQLIDRLYTMINQIKGKKGGANLAVKIKKAAEALNIEDPSALYQFLCSYHQQPSTLLKGTDDLTQPDLNAFNKDYLSAAMAWDQAWYLPGDNLFKSDRASMAVSLEMRVPLLDKELIEFSWRVSNSLKYKDGQSKWLLRQLLYKKVPREIIERPKMGFTVPISQWIRTDLKEWSQSLLSERFIQDQQIFENRNVQSILEKHLSGTADHGNRLWALLMFQSWYQKYYKNTPF